MKELLEAVGSTASEPLPAGELRAFEDRHGISLPEEYRDFLQEIANGIDAGPTYGLLPLGQVPEHWRRAYDYSDTLNRPFTFSDEWIWDDDDLEDQAVGRRLERVRDGVLLLGEEGCGANWTLVVSGDRRGEVWLMTGEGMAPCRPRMGFLEWLERRIRGGFGWWASLVSHWGPHENAYFHYHAARQAPAARRSSGYPDPFQIDQSSPLCESCIEFFGQFANHHELTVIVTDPRHRRLFHPDGKVSVLPPVAKGSGKKKAPFGSRWLHAIRSKLAAK